MAASPRFYELLDRIRDLHDRKNADYSHGDDPFRNFRQCELFGVPAWKGVLVRLSDKWSRIGSLVAKGEEHRAVVDESLDDTLMDLAVYALICLVLREESREPAS